MRDFEFSTAFTQFLYFIFSSRNEEQKVEAYCNTQGGREADLNILLHSFKTTGAAQGGGGLKFRSGVELRNMVMIHSEGIRNSYSVLNI